MVCGVPFYFFASSEKENQSKNDTEDNIISINILTTDQGENSSFWFIVLNGYLNNNIK